MSVSLYYNVPATATGSNFGDFTFIATDQTGTPSAPITVVFAIAHNNPPGANSTSVNATQDQTTAPFTLSGYDVDVADQGSLTISITALPTRGYLTQGSTNITAPTVVTGPLTYTTFERGIDSFSFQVVDNVGGTSPIKQVPISITSVNHPPVVSFTGSGLTTDENTNLLISQMSAYDIDGDVVTLYVGSIPTFGYLTQYDGTPITANNTAITDPQYRVIYVPAATLTGQSTTFTFYAGDNSGASNSNTAEISVPISVTHVNRPPVVYNSVLGLNYGVLSGALTPNVTDDDSAPGTLSITIQSIPNSAIGYLTYNGVTLTGGETIPYPFTNLVFNAQPSTYGYTSFSFSASDGTATSSTNAIYGVGVRSP